MGVRATLPTHIPACRSEFGPKICLVLNYFLTQSSFWPKFFFWPKVFLDLKLFWNQIFLDLILAGLNSFLAKFLPDIFWPTFFEKKKYFGPNDNLGRNSFWTWNFLDQKFFLTKNSFWPIIFSWQKKYFGPNINLDKKNVWPKMLWITIFIRPRKSLDPIISLIPYYVWVTKLFKVRRSTNTWHCVSVCMFVVSKKMLGHF